jgi:hypothetical protein
MCSGFSKTRSIPYWTMIVVSSTVTELVLIYESLTSDLQMTYESQRINDE